MTKSELETLDRLLRKFKEWTESEEGETMELLKNNPAMVKLYDEHMQNKTMLDAVIGWVGVKSWSVDQTKRNEQRLN